MENRITSKKYSNKAIDNSSDNDEGMDLDDWTPPAVELVQKMVSQAEFYLSDENLAKDAFLLKHVRRNRLGYVNVKLLTSFKKIRQLTKDWRITAYALRQSVKLELNKEGTKVRRKDPIPESLLVQAPSRLLLVWNIPEALHGGDLTNPSRSSMQSAIGILSPFGPISSIRVVRPGMELPPEIRKYACRYHELCSQDCVLVEYEDVGGAGRAYRELSQAGGVIRALLVRRSARKVSRHATKHMEDGCSRKGIDALVQQMVRLEHGGDDFSACSSSEFDSMASSSPKLSPSNIPLSTYPRSTPHSSPRVLHSPLLSYSQLTAVTHPELGCPGQGGFRQVGAAAIDFQMQSLTLPIPQTPTLEETHKLRHLGLKKTPNGDPVPLGVIRLPYGPNGTTGFHTVAGRGRHQSKVSEMSVPAGRGGFSKSMGDSGN